MKLIANANICRPTSGMTHVIDHEFSLLNNFNRQSAKILNAIAVGAVTLSTRGIHATLGKSRGASGIESPLATK